MYYVMQWLILKYKNSLNYFRTYMQYIQNFIYTQNPCTWYCQITNQIPKSLIAKSWSNWLSILWNQLNYKEHTSVRTSRTFLKSVDMVANLDWNEMKFIISCIYIYMSQKREEIQRDKLGKTKTHSCPWLSSRYKGRRSRIPVNRLQMSIVAYYIYTLSPYRSRTNHSQYVVKYTGSWMLCFVTMI